MMRFAAGAAALLLAACAAIAPQAPLPSLTAVPASFEMSGRLAVRHGTSSDIAQLRWTRRGKSDVWVIASPLGNEVARIESTPGGATMSCGGGVSGGASVAQAAARRSVAAAARRAIIAAPQARACGQ